MAAIRQRLRTIDVSRAPHGCFQCLPETVSSYGDLSKMIKGAVNRHWGTVARAFLRQLVEDRARDEAALVKRIEGRVRRFKRRLLEDGFTLDDRTADFFGVIYATGRLARDYGALPKGWGKPVDTTLAAVRFLDIPASAEPLSVEFVKGQVERYARRHVRDILAAANVSEPLSGSEFRAAAGFWITEKGVEAPCDPGRSVQAGVSAGAEHRTGHAGCRASSLRGWQESQADAKGSPQAVHGPRRARLLIHRGPFEAWPPIERRLGSLIPGQDRLRRRSYSLPTRHCGD